MRPLKMRLRGGPRVGMEEGAVLTRYRLIYADPPWRYNDKRKGRGGAEGHYRTASMAEIAGHIAPLAADDCTLAAWQTWPMEQAQDDLFRGLGFRKIGLLFLWLKTTKNGKEHFGGGLAGTRANTEPCFLWRMGRPLKRACASVRQVIREPIGEHSRKPDEARLRLERLYGPVPRIEMYRRGAPPPGWDAWGDEVE